MIPKNRNIAFKINNINEYNFIKKLLISHYDVNEEDIPQYNPYNDSRNVLWFYINKYIDKNLYMFENFEWDTTKKINPNNYKGSYYYIIQSDILINKMRKLKLKKILI